MADDKKTTRTVTATLPNELADRLAAAVEAEERTTSIVIKRALQRYLDAEHPEDVDVPVTDTNATTQAPTRPPIQLQ